VLRTAFQNEYFSGIDGLIWSRRSTGNFLSNTDDLVYVHNQPAAKALAELVRRVFSGRWRLEAATDRIYALNLL